MFMEDLKRIIQVFTDQIELCGSNRWWVTMTADDSKKIVEWLEAYNNLVERHKALVDMTQITAGNRQMSAAIWQKVDK